MCFLAPLMSSDANIISRFDSLPPLSLIYGFVAPLHPPPVSFPRLQLRSVTSKCEKFMLLMSCSKRVLHAALLHSYIVWCHVASLPFVLIFFCVCMCVCDILTKPTHYLLNSVGHQANNGVLATKHHFVIRIISALGGSPLFFLSSWWVLVCLVVNEIRGHTLKWRMDTRHLVLGSNPFPKKGVWKGNEFWGGLKYR